VVLESELVAAVEMARVVFNVALVLDVLVMILDLVLNMPALVL
jgi:hypothetical protein